MSVMISDDMWADLCAYFLDNDIGDDVAKLLWDEIVAEIHSKLASMHRRQLFTNYRTAASEDERNVARTAYLDAAGVRDSFRSTQPPPEPPSTLSS